MPHLNDLQSKYGDQGLTVIGVTSEGKSQTEAWIEEHGPEYAYAYFKGSKLGNSTGQRGYPHSALINPEGVIVWTGHPSSLRDSIIEEHLDGAMPFPLFEFPKHASKVKKAILGDKLAKALEEAQKLVTDGEPQANEILEAVQGMVTTAVSSMQAAHSAGNFLRVVEKGPKLVKSLDDLPQAGEIQTLLDAIDEDDHAQDVIDAQKSILKMKDGVEKLKKRSQVDKLVDKLDAIREEFPDSYVSDQADEFTTELKKLRPNLK